MKINTDINNKEFVRKQCEVLMSDGDKEYFETRLNNELLLYEEEWRDGVKYDLGLYVNRLKWHEGLIPDGFKYAALDKAGVAYVYKNIPILVDSEWRHRGYLLGVKCIGSAFHFHDWKNSLIKKDVVPQGEALVDRLCGYSNISLEQAKENAENLTYIKIIEAYNNEDGYKTVGEFFWDYAYQVPKEKLLELAGRCE